MLKSGSEGRLHFSVTGQEAVQRTESILVNKMYCSWGLTFLKLLDVN